MISLFLNKKYYHHKYYKPTRKTVPVSEFIVTYPFHFVTQIYSETEKQNFRKRDYKNYIVGINSAYNKTECNKKCIYGNIKNGKQS